ncbi:unnamed protein product [Cuscuta campestris]|uniref:Uncharacterized protein n=1 Tax=Cuscuta campestris TaxID=132261 RepID=A0A484NIS7_9ASTE|nr:unnamed protein product [Cuscuta campestris]
MFMDHSVMRETSHMAHGRMDSVQFGTPSIQDFQKHMEEIKSPLKKFLSLVVDSEIDSWERWTELELQGIKTEFSHFMGEMERVASH